MAEETPVIICGPARSGTTAIRGMLNSHADFLISGEVPLGKLPSLRPLLAELAEYHQDWTLQQRRATVRTLWSATSSAVQDEDLTTRRWGMKTPWSELDRDLWTPFIEPRYVYALRRGDRVFNSHLRLGWNAARSPRRLLERYKDSLRAADRLLADGSGHIVQLDLAHDHASRTQLADSLLSFLGENADAGVRRFVDEWPSHWSQPTSTGTDAELPTDWQALLAADHEYQELMNSHGY